MQGYFSYFPDLNYVSRSIDRSSNDEFIPVKNIFRRPKLRDDLKSVLTAFEDYVVLGDDRPEQVSERVYGDPRFDWVILTTNNITKVRDQWPLSANDFQNYFLNDFPSGLVGERGRREKKSKKIRKFTKSGRECGKFSKKYY